MTRYYFIVFVVTILGVAAAGQDCNKEDAIAFLNGLFKGGKYISYDSSEFRNFSKDLETLETPTLHKLVPGYCFFSTFFNSNHFEYNNVETVIALSTDDKTKSKIVHSPVYADTPDEFINLFLGIKTSGTFERLEVAKVIADIFRSITYKGQLTRLINVKEKNAVSFELWHGDLSWRIYNFIFDRNGVLTKIEIDKGFGRGEMNSKYSRLRRVSCGLGWAFLW